MDWWKLKCGSVASNQVLAEQIEVLSAFEKHVRRVWDAQDECSLALRSSAELAGTAFNRSHPELGSEGVGAAFPDTGQHEVRRRAGAIVDEVVAKPELPFWVKLTALLELATYEVSPGPEPRRGLDTISFSPTAPLATESWCPGLRT